MNFLKKTLGRDEPKKDDKGSKQPNTTLPLRKNKQIWSNIDELIENVRQVLFSAPTKRQSWRALKMSCSESFDSLTRVASSSAKYLLQPTQS
jgi:hypothetical protein